MQLDHGCWEYSKYHFIDEAVAAEARTVTQHPTMLLAQTKE
jgi:hypothetical protein